MGKNVSAVAVVVASLACTAVLAEDGTLGELRAKGAQKVPEEGLSAILTGATVISENKNGVREWLNGKDGTLDGSSALMGSKGFGKRGEAHGTWKVDGDKYCVDIVWKTSTEKWCREIYKSGDAYYWASSGKDAAKVTPIQIRK